MPKESEETYEQKCRAALQSGNMSEFKLQFSRWLYWYKVTEKSRPYYAVYRFFEGEHNDCVQVLDSPGMPPELRIYAVLSYITLDDYARAANVLDEMRVRFENDPKAVAMLDVIEAVVHFMQGKLDAERKDLFDAVAHDKQYAIDYIHSILSSIDDPASRSRLKESFSAIIPEV
ncbi:MAG: hypothetical protein N3G76_01500 [Candidatus Micrarchaeota archaeon]|nr:hypothetical protein [Candidatus Micrarchaeota archaeon]